MTLIIGLKSSECVVVGAEQEETRGIVARGSVNKLRLITGNEWAVVIGGAGDAALAENAMRDFERRLRQEPTVNDQILTDTTDKVLDEIYTKYVDKDPKSEGLSLVIGASCGDELHLISTAKRVPQHQDYMAYAGIGADIGIYFMERLSRQEADWRYTASVAGFTLQQAIEFCQYCGGDQDVYVLQLRPNPRWRYLGDDASHAFADEFSGVLVARNLENMLENALLFLHRSIGYQDEHHPEPKTYDEAERERLEEIAKKATKQ